MIREDQDATRRIYRSSLLSIGQFRRGPKHSNFKGPHLIAGTLLVFPRTSVSITFAGEHPVVADPNTVMFYNRSQVYSRGKLSERGDLCEWFNFDAAVVADAIRAFDPHVDDRPMKPFSFSHGPSDTKSYLLQRLIVDHVLGDQRHDHLFIEETALHVLHRIIDNCYHLRGVYPCRMNISAEGDTVAAIRKILATHVEHNPSLEQIAAQLHYSPFHLCRVFRRHTGQTIHQYLNQLRLRTSLEYVTQPGMDLTTLALKMGFASHSHFTEAFRKTFGTSPSDLRKESRRYVHRMLSKISIA